jgi:drug/metabolite transporter (DMT)-like permease
LNLFWRTTLAMSAFAGNSLLCRLALRQTNIDAASFTTVRLVSGALFLWWLLRRRSSAARGDNVSALALWVYAAAFSFAYLGLTAATGALILFGTVQVTMIGTALVRGERLSPRQGAGALLAIAGLAALLLPGVAAPPWFNGLLMIGAGVAWGVYSLRGKGVADPLAATAGNFMRSVVPALLLSLLTLPQLSLDGPGVLYAVASGALASGAGYAVWYSVLPRLSATQAASVQLCVPVLAALAGVALLGEALTTRLVLCAAVVLTGVALVSLPAKPAAQRSPRR